MKAEKWVFWFIFLFFVVVTPIYWFSAHEPAGAVALALAFIVGAWLWAYLHIQGKKIDARYEDNPDAAYAAPTADHFLPLLYTLGAAQGEKPEIFNNVRNTGSLSMTGYLFGFGEK